MRTLPALALRVLVAAPARAGRLDEIRARGKLVVSVKNDAKRPHRDPAHEAKRGFELELVHALAASLAGAGDKVELRILARPVRLPMLDLGSVDLVVSMIPVTDETRASFALSHPYFAAGLSLLVRADSTTTKLEELRGKTVAVLKQGFNDHGAELTRVAKARGVPLTARYYPSFDAAAEAVRSGEAAALAGSSVDLDLYRQSHAGFRFAGEPLQRTEYAVAMKKGDDALVAAVNDVIDRLQQSGELARMATRWHLPTAR